MKKSSPHRISTEITSEKIKIVNDIDLNSLFNLNYNFDLLKGIIETLLKNQEAIQKQLDEVYSSNFDKNKEMENVEKQIKYIKDLYIDKGTFMKLESEVDKIKERLNKTDKRIDECKIYLITYIFIYSVQKN
jgi:uncharacterized protein YjcR